MSYQSVRVKPSGSGHAPTTRETLQFLQISNTEDTDDDSKTHKVFLTSKHYEPTSLALLKSFCNVKSWDHDETIPHDVLLKEVQGVNAIYCNVRDHIDAEVIRHAGPQLKCIATVSAGFDHIDCKECYKRGIRVGYANETVADAAADLTVALLLATSRRLFEANRAVKMGTWKNWSYDWMSGVGVKDSCVGFFGFGRIGKEVATRLKGFKPSLIIYTNRSMVPANHENAVLVNFQELLTDADFIIACSSLTPQTKGIFNESAFNRMKPNAIFINASRGAVVNQTDLFMALKTKRIRAAGIDVTTPEPLPPDSPLLTLDNLIVLPHIGACDIETKRHMSRITVQNILGALFDGVMMFEVGKGSSP